MQPRRCARGLRRAATYRDAAIPGLRIVPGLAKGARTGHPPQALNRAGFGALTWAGELPKPSDKRESLSQVGSPSATPNLGHGAGSAVPDAKMKMCRIEFRGAQLSNTAKAGASIVHKTAAHRRLKLGQPPSMQMAMNPSLAVAIIKHHRSIVVKA